MKNKKGFTLVELIAVVSIIGVLIIVFVPFLTNVFSRTKNNLNKMDKDALYDGVKSYLTNLEQYGYNLDETNVYNDQCVLVDVLSNMEIASYVTSTGDKLSGYDFVKYAAENDLYITAEYLVDKGYFNKGCSYSNNRCESTDTCKVDKECTLVVHYESDKVKANPNCTSDTCEYYYRLGDYSINILDESKCVIK